MRSALVVVLALATGCFFRPEVPATSDATASDAVRDVPTDDDGDKIHTALAVQGIITFTLPNNVLTKVPYVTELYDDEDEFHQVENSFTAKTAGDYFVCAGLMHAGVRMELDLYKNGVRTRGLGWGTTVASGCRVIRLVAADTLEVYAHQQSGATVTVITNTVWDWLTIHRMPSSLAATTSTEVDLGSGLLSKLPYDVEVYDDAAAYDGGVSQYKAPQDEDVLVCASITVGTNTTGSELDVMVDNGRVSAFAWGYGVIDGCRSVRLMANDILEVFATQYSGGLMSVPVNALWNTLTIHRQPMSVSAANLTAFTLASNTFTKVPYVSEVVDVNGEFAETTNTFTAQSAGDYLFCASFDTRDQTHTSEIDLFKNGTREVGVAHELGAQIGCRVLRLAAADRIAVQAHHTSVGSDSIVSDPFWQWFQVSKL